MASKGAGKWFAVLLFLSMVQVRRTTKTGPVDGVDILAIISDKDNKKVVIVKQFRPPMNSFVMEFPAGLIDPNELPETSAVRELQEETGYKATVEDVKLVSPPLALEPGICNSTTSLVRIDINQEELSKLQNIKQDLQDDEFIEVLLIPLHNLFDTLQELSSDAVIDAKLYTFAYALKYANNIL